MTDYGVFAGMQLHGWDSVTSSWVKVLVDDEGRVQIVSTVANLDDIGDVSVAAPTDGYVLYWDNATSLWKCKAIPSGAWADITGKPTAPSLEELATEHDAAGTHAPILENPPTEDEAAKAPTSEWAFDHNANAAAHHAKYTDAEAIAAAKTDPTLLNYTSGARAYRATDQSINSGSWTKVILDTENWDILGEFDKTTNYRFTAQAAGKYLVIVVYDMIGPATASAYWIATYLNGVIYAARKENVPAGAAGAKPLLLDIMSLAASEYLEMYVYQDSGSAKNLLGGSAASWMSIQRLA